MSKIFTPEEAAATLRHCVNEQHCMECAMYPHLRSGKCTMKLCAAAADTIEALIEENKRLREENQWISVEERLPEGDLLVLVIVSGRVGNIHLDRAIELAEFSMDEGWILEMWPEWENPTVTHWKPMPKGPEVGHDNQ